MHNSQLPDDFDPLYYLELNPDVKAKNFTPEQHYLEFGRNEGRLYRPQFANQLTDEHFIAGVPSDMDKILHSNPQTKRPNFAKHTNIWEWVRSHANSENFRVLEIGSRSVVSDAIWKKVIPKCDYVGFDIIEGKNVNVIGDAHFLSDYFPSNSFDMIISFAVFEHLAMPWLVAEEITKLLKVNGHVCIETHFSFSEHELPWHFFQFNSHALEALFNRDLGYEILDSGIDTPIVGRFSHEAPVNLRGKMVPNLYCHSSIIAKKIFHNSSLVDGFNWRGAVKILNSESMYPKYNKFD